VPFPVAGRLQRVDRVDLIAGGDQRLHPRAAFGLDAHDDRRHLVVITQVFADHRMQPGNARHALGQLPTAEHPPGLVLQLDVVVIFRPVVSNKQQLPSAPQ
jgi:hypothetical protein